MPAPKTTQVEPASTFAVFIAAPRPVESPHANRHACSGGASGLTFASAISGITVYSANVEQPMKCRTGSPFRASRVVPSGRKPWFCCSRIARQRFVRSLGSARTRGTAARRASPRGRPAQERSRRRRPARRCRRPRGRAPSARSRTDRRPKPCRDPCGRRRTRRAGRAPRPPSAPPGRPPGRRAAARTPRGLRP